MLTAFLVKRRGYDAGEPDDRAEVELELSRLREQIASYRLETITIYDHFDRRERDLMLAGQSTDEVRADRLEIALERTEALKDMRRREAELEQMLGDGW